MRFTKPSPIAPQSVRTNATIPPYWTVNQVVFTRYFYLKMLVVFIVVLVAAAVAYAVFLRPLDQIVGNAAGIVLGVWGVRNLLRNGYPPDTTAVDVLLEAIVFLLLIFVTVRTVNLLRIRAGWGGPVSTTEEDPASAEPRSSGPSPG